MYNDKVKEIKDKLIDRMHQELSQNGATRINVNEFGALADIIKDLSETLYYCTVTEAMEGKDKQQFMGYSQGSGMRGYSGGQGGSQGSQGGNQGSMGYSGGMMGHTDPVSTIRDMLASADPMTRADLYNQISELFH